MDIKGADDSVNIVKSSIATYLSYTSDNIAEYDRLVEELLGMLRIAEDMKLDISRISLSLTIESSLKRARSIHESYSKRIK
jgi:hypothetical protein